MLENISKSQKESTNVGPEVYKHALCLILSNIITSLDENDLFCADCIGNERIFIISNISDIKKGIFLFSF